MGAPSPLGFAIMIGTVIVATVVLALGDRRRGRRRAAADAEHETELREQQQASQITIRDCVLSPVIMRNIPYVGDVLADSMVLSSGDSYTYVSADIWHCATHNEMIRRGTSLPVAISIHVRSHRFDGS